MSKISLNIKDREYRWFSNYADFFSTLVQVYKEKLIQVLSKPIDDITLGKDSICLINMELSSYRYKDKFEQIGWKV